MFHDGIRCHLHIGAPKTGSTALQRFLTANLAALEDRGYLYPPATLRGYGHHDLAFFLSGGYPPWATPRERELGTIERELSEELSATSASNSERRIVLSSENFYLLCAPEKLAAMLTRMGLPPDAVNVVVYVRRQDEAHISWYNQAVKAQGYAGEILPFIESHRPLWDYAGHLDRWAKAFDPARITVRPYQDSDIPDLDIRLDFLRLLQLSPGDFLLEDEKPNSGLNADLTEFQRTINRLPLSVQEKRRFHREMIALSAATAGSGLFDESSPLSNEERQALLDAYREGNARVASTYLGRAQLFDESLPPPSRREPPLSQEKLVYILGWILARGGNA